MSFYSNRVMPGQTFIEGDINNDSVVNFDDYGEIGKYYGLDLPIFDYNKNGKIDIDDLKEFLMRKK